MATSRSFENNVKLWSSMDGVIVHQGDSTKLEPAKLRELAGGDIRFFSVDGGHTRRDRVQRHEARGDDAG